jgi:xanthine dehydrogenase YagR molybdenum-binding subunit
MSVLNHDLVRLDARDKVTGRAKYTHDVRAPGMAYARLLLSPVPAAKITKIDVEPALKVPGVLGAIVLQSERTDWLGEPIAAVAATTPDRAEDGLRAIVLEYSKQPWAIDFAQATAAGAPEIWDEVDLRKETKTVGDEDDAKEKLAGAAAVIEQTYTVPVQHHVCLETHGVVVDFKGGDEATVWCSSQATFGFAPDAAKELGLKAGDVTGRVEYMGGGFGSKFGLEIPGMAACRLAKQIGRPVHLMLTRSDEFLAAGNRSAARASVKLGGASDGKLLAMVADRRRMGGMGGGSLRGDEPYIYSVETFFTRTLPVPMNMDASRAMRAPGHPQASFIIESAIDELAYALRIDPLTLRKKNLKDPVYARQLDRVAREIGWEQHPHKAEHGKPASGIGVGIGFAVATWGGGGRGGTEAEVRIERDGSVSASVGTQDLGTGTRTLVAAITAEELGLRLADVTARIGSTKLPKAGGSGGSVTTGSLSPPVKDAAFNARIAFAEHIAPTLGVPADRVRFAGGRVADAGGGKSRPG